MGILFHKLMMLLINIVPVFQVASELIDRTVE
jgi:hypothetical protein